RPVGLLLPVFDCGGWGVLGTSLPQKPAALVPIGGDGTPCCADIYRPVKDRVLQLSHIDVATFPDRVTQKAEQVPGVKKANRGHAIAESLHKRNDVPGDGDAQVAPYWW